MTWYISLKTVPSAKASIINSYDDEEEDYYYYYIDPYLVCIDM